MFPLPDRYQGTEIIEYDKSENAFFDQCGKRIINIYDMVTPDDIFLFRRNPEKHHEFYNRDNPCVVYQIIWNGEYTDEKNNIHINCNISPRGGCWFSSNEVGSREEICRACRGGDC